MSREHSYYENAEDSDHSIHMTGSNDVNNSRSSRGSLHHRKSGDVGRASVSANSPGSGGPIVSDVEDDYPDSDLSVSNLDYDDNDNSFDNENNQKQPGGHHHHHHHQPAIPMYHHSNAPMSSSLGKYTLAVMVFYGVSGGPFGVEASVRSGGYMYTMIAFIIGPFIWSIQEALMTAELACVFQEAAGGMAWVEEAFGPMAGWQAGFLGWMAGATDNSIYPVLFLDYLIQILGNSEASFVTLHPVVRFIGLGITSCILSYINWLGLEIVGKMSIVICCIALSPFVLMTVIGIFQVDFSRLFELPDPAEVALLQNVTDDDTGGGFFPNAGVVSTGILWRPFLNNLFWNLNSFDAGASFSADVGEHPERVIPPAMMYALIMVIVSYILPLAVAIGASSSQPYQWEDGYLATIAREIAGPWLETWMIFAAGVSNIAMFQAELSADAFQLMGMADRGHVPKIFTHRSRHGTPTYGILLGTAIIVLMGASGLDKLIEMLNFNYAISLLMEYTAFLKLRIYHPELHRPWKIPLGTVGCIIFFAPTYFFILLVLALSNYEAYIFSICVNTFGVLLYLGKQGKLDHCIVYLKRICSPRWIFYTPASSKDEVNNNNIFDDSSRSPSPTKSPQHKPSKSDDGGSIMMTTRRSNDDYHNIDDNNKSMTHTVT